MTDAIVATCVAPTWRVEIYLRDEAYTAYVLRAVEVAGVREDRVDAQHAFRTLSEAIGYGRSLGVCTVEVGPSQRLHSTGQIYVTLRAALDYHRAIGAGDEQQGLEGSRRVLTQLLLDARPSTSEDPTIERWRVRGAADLTAVVTRDGPLAVVTAVHVHHVKRS